MKKPIFILAIIVTKKIQVVLFLKKRSVSQLITDAKSYTDGITKNPTIFPNPVPSLASVNTLSTNLHTAEIAAANRAKDAVKVRNAAKKTLELALVKLASYVQGIANADPDNALAIVALANMIVKKHNKAVKNDFTMVQGKNKGELLMTAKSEKGRVTFNFELSTDTSNPANWKSVQNTSLAKALIGGLAIGTRYYGRVSRTDRKGTNQIGQVLSLVVN
jgi:hypothetical protein